MNDLRKEATKEITRYITAGLGLVAGLAWNEAIREAIEIAFPLDKNTVLAKFIYAIIITLIVVFISTYLIRIINKPNQDNNK